MKASLSFLFCFIIATHPPTSPNTVQVLATIYEVTFKKGRGRRLGAVCTPASGVAAAGPAAAANVPNASTVVVAGDSSLIHEYLGDVDDDQPSSPEETMDGSMDDEDDEEVRYEDDEHSLNSPFDDGGRSVVLSDEDGIMEEGL